MMTLREELLNQLSQLNEFQQQRLLNYARMLNQSPSLQGELGSSIIQATGFFDAESLDEMQAAIEEGCEKI